MSMPANILQTILAQKMMQEKSPQMTPVSPTPLQQATGTVPAALPNSPVGLPGVDIDRSLPEKQMPPPAGVNPQAILGALSAIKNMQGQPGQMPQGQLTNAAPRQTQSVGELLFGRR